MKLSELNRLMRNLPPSFDPTSEQQRNDFLRAQGMETGKIYQELEMDSPFADTHEDTSYNNGQVHLHSHNFYELIYCRNNCGAEYLVGTDRYRLQRGDIVFVPAGVSHRPILPERMEEPYRRYVLWLSPAFMERYAELLPYPLQGNDAGANMLRTAGTPWEGLGELFRAGVKEAERQEDGWQAALVGNAVTLLTRIKRAAAGKTVVVLPAEKPQLLDRIMAFVEANYGRSLSMEEVAKHFFVSSSTLSHLFREKLGVSFYRYVTQRRLVEAKILIGQGLPMETVCARTGFGDYSVFYRAFKQEFGISPRQYRTLQ